jgi:hypothetical protein
MLGCPVRLVAAVFEMMPAGWGVSVCIGCYPMPEVRQREVGRGRIRQEGARGKGGGRV